MQTKGRPTAAVSNIDWQLGTPIADWIEQGLTSYQTHYRSYRG